MRAEGVDGRPPEMSAVRWRGRRDVRLERVAVPVPADAQALVRVLWAGLCGSDLEEYLHGPVVIRGPVTLGHEIVGVVEAPAADGSGPAAGTVVVVDVVTGCGACYWCDRHEEGLCPDLMVIGQDSDGGLAEYVAARADRLVVVPPGLDPKLAALAEPTAVAVRAARKLGAVMGRGVALIGGGTIGLLLGQLLRAAGAEPVVVVEPSSSRLALIERLGLAGVWADTAEARRQELLARFPARGLDAVIECSGADGAADEALGLVRAGGVGLILGVFPDRQPMDLKTLVLGERTLIGSAAHMWDDDVVPAVALLASGAVDAGALISHTLPLSRAKEAFDLLADPSAGTLKVLIRVAGTEPIQETP